MAVEKNQVRKRDMTFVNRTRTRIWQETPTEENPYLAEQCRCHGYDILELAGKRSFAEVLFLLFQGELPTPEQAEMLEFLCIAMINPGPRHPATRAAMNAAVSKTHPQHLLPIGLSVLGGAHLGSAEVLASMRFLTANLKRLPAEVAEESLAAPRPDEGDFHAAPGFGSRFGGIDPMPRQLAAQLGTLPGAGRALAWGAGFAEELTPQGLGWLGPGVAAAVFCDLGFHYRVGAGLYQLISAPGVLAHGLELANKPITAMPFLDEEHYVIAAEAKK
ncbi:MAG: citrate synthase [Desulfobulbaceae bacterium]|nr:MAG: citrate synthase [Desulfobulbaceae bacterium]